MAGARVVIAEDEGVVALEVRVRLVAAGHHVVAWVMTGEEAVERALRGDVDLVVMDVTLKGDLDGLEAVRRLRAASCPVPVLFITAHGDLVAERARTGYAPCACLTKPFDGSTLGAAVSKLLT